MDKKFSRGIYVPGELMKIQEVIVVEGSNDTKKLQSFFDVETIETHGTHLNKTTLKLIEKVQKDRGIIIFTDPDAPGEKIRTMINQYVEGCKNAFVFKQDARTSKKVGIEHASKDILEQSLNHFITYQTEPKETLSLNDFQQLGLNGQINSQALRDIVSKKYFLGKCNAKTQLKRLNMLSVSKKEIENLLKNI